MLNSVKSGLALHSECIKTEIRSHYTNNNNNNNNKKKKINKKKIKNKKIIVIIILNLTIRIYFQYFLFNILYVAPAIVP